MVRIYIYIENEGLDVFASILFLWLCVSLAQNIGIISSWSFGQFKARLQRFGQDSVILTLPGVLQHTTQAQRQINSLRLATIGLLSWEKLMGPQNLQQFYPIKWEKSPNFTRKWFRDDCHHSDLGGEAASCQAKPWKQGKDRKGR